MQDPSWREEVLLKADRTGQDIALPVPLSAQSSKAGALPGKTVPWPLSPVIWPSPVAPGCMLMPA